MLLSAQREKIREKFVAALKKEFAGKGLRFTKGERVENRKTRSRGTRVMPKCVMEAKITSAVSVFITLPKCC